jgi:hypothetical protein
VTRLRVLPRAALAGLFVLVIAALLLRRPLVPPAVAAAA